jgi:hypothetical protein
MLQIRFSSSSSATLLGDAPSPFFFFLQQHMRKPRGEGRPFRDVSAYLLLLLQLLLWLRARMPASHGPSSCCLQQQQVNAADAPAA